MLLSAISPQKKTPSEQRLIAFAAAQTICATGKPSSQPKSAYWLSPSYWLDALPDRNAIEAFVCLGKEISSLRYEDTYDMCKIISHLPTGQTTAEQNLEVIMAALEQRKHKKNLATFLHHTAKRVGATLLQHPIF